MAWALHKLKLLPMYVQYIPFALLEVVYLCERSPLWWFGMYGLYLHFKFRMRCLSFLLRNIWRARDVSLYRLRLFSFKNALRGITICEEICMLSYWLNTQDVWRQKEKKISSAVLFIYLINIQQNTYEKKGNPILKL